ncbi:hypothetical protein ACP275_06G037000 [Erythranthe tilingii]
MGKTGKWFRSLLTSKKSPSDSSSLQTAAPAKEKEKKKKKSKWALSKSNYNKLQNGEPSVSRYTEGMDANKHAIAVAAATAAVAEAALAAAQAAAEVVRLTSGGGSGRNVVRSCIGGDRRRVTAAIKIQSAFRAYLARRALRALKGLVKLQALVRGHIVRKQSAEMLRRMQSMARIQARASAHRSYLPDFSDSRRPGIVNPRNYYQRLTNTKHGGSMTNQYNSRLRTSNNSMNEEEASDWLDHWMEQQSTWDHHRHYDNETSDKILEVDTWKPLRHVSRRADRTFPTSQSFSEKLQKPIINPSVSSESSPRVLGSSSTTRPNGDHLRGAVTPTRSECSRSMFGDYYYRNYMANTESSRAKVRSQSVPKQRLGISSNVSRNLWELDSENGLRGNTSLHQGAPYGFSSTYG